MRRLFRSVRVSRLKVRVRILKRGKKKKERRKKRTGIQSKRWGNHGDAEARRKLNLRVSVSSWLVKSLCTYLLLISCYLFLPYFITSAHASIQESRLAAMSS